MKQTLTFLLPLFWLLPNFLLLVIGEESVVAFFSKKIVFLATCLSFAWIGLFLLPPKLYLVLTSPLLVFQVFELAHIAFFKMLLTPRMLVTSLNTNPVVVKELLSGHSLYFGILLLVIIIYAWGIKKIPWSFKLERNVRFTCLFFFLLINGTVLARDTLLASKVGESDSLLGHVQFGWVIHSGRHGKIYPVNTLSHLHTFLEFQQQAKNYYQKIDGFSFNSEELDTTNHPKTIVLVLGETARSDHFSLNGYSRNTNPKLSAISNLISFSRAYSPSNLTQPSMAMLFSRATPQTFQRVYQEPSFITAFKENDYKVYWFSNHDYSPSSPIGFYSEEADTLIQNNISLSAPKGTDSSLVELFKNSFKTTSSIKKRLFIIHTLGSHFRYSSRYPDSFEQFTPVLPQNLPITSINQTFKQELINSYDNSILYTDYVLAQLIRTLEKEQGISLLTYVSDHGENLLEAPNHLILHGNPNPTEKEIHVPMLTWFSKEYQYAFPKKILALRQNKDLFFSTSLFPFYLWGLANIHIPEAILHLGDTQYQEPDTLFVLSDEYRGGILQKTPINQYQMEPHY